MPAHLRLVSSTELFEGIQAIPGSKDAGAVDGMPQSRVVNGIEFGRATATDERTLRAAWKRRQGGGPAPLVLTADDHEWADHVRVLGPDRDGPLRRVRADALLELVREIAGLGRVEAVRRLTRELERFDAVHGSPNQIS